MATIYDNDIAKFENVFELFETYKISNSRISSLNEKYNIYGYPYQWTISTRTDVSREVSQAIPKSTMKLNFESIAKLKSETENNEMIGIALNYFTILIK